MVRSCTSHPGVLGSIPKREEPLPLPPASSNSQDQQPNRPNPTPTQRRLTQQLSAHWPQFKALNWEHLRQRYAGTRFGEQRSASSTCLNPWLGAIRPTSANDVFDPALWETFVSATLGLVVPVLSLFLLSPATIIARLPSAAAKNAAWIFGDHTRTCTAHSGASKAHEWMVSVLGPLFLAAGHTVRTQHGVTASTAWKYETTCESRLAAGAWSSTSASRMTASGAVATPCKMGCYARRT